MVENGEREKWAWFMYCADRRSWRRGVEQTGVSGHVMSWLVLLLTSMSGSLAYVTTKGHGLSCYLRPC